MWLKLASWFIFWLLVRRPPWLLGACLIIFCLFFSSGADYRHLHPPPRSFWAEVSYRQHCSKLSSMWFGWRDRRIVVLLYVLIILYMRFSLCKRAFRYYRQYIPLHRIWFLTFVLVIFRAGGFRATLGKISQKLYFPTHAVCRKRNFPAILHRVHFAFVAFCILH